jgi:hypothetical protein
MPISAWPRYYHTIESRSMRLGDILLYRGLVTMEGLERALRRQREKSGRLGEHLLELGLISHEQLFAVLEETPTSPLNVAQTGISRASLLGLMLKFMRMDSCEVIPDLSSRMGLPHSVIQELIDEATTQKLVQTLGSNVVGLVRYIRYSLSDLGRVAAADALAQSAYLGPAPVSLTAFQSQVRKQAIGNENMREENFRQGFADLNVPDVYVRKLLPAIRAGRTILLYGPPGNGKTSIGTRISKLFRDVIYIPYAMEIAGQIIKIYDTGVHKPYDDGKNKSLSDGQAVKLEGFDARWVPCRRPVAMAGGELTLEMLDLRFDPITKYYDAPLHMKALNGLFLIDDFGRQKVNPTELLNRWIVPLESRIDYLTLNTGMSFMIPFDELVLFSTNLKPADLMDPAFLRRIPYKIEVLGPELAEYKKIFEIVAKKNGLTMSDDAFYHIVRRLRGGNYDLAYFQPNFLCEQISQVCTCFDEPREITIALAEDALKNLYVDLA